MIKSINFYFIVPSPRCHIVDVYNRSYCHSNEGKWEDTVRHDTIRHVYLHALKGWWDVQLSQAHHTETKNKEKLKQKPSSSEETVGAKVREGSSSGRSETTGGGIEFVKQVDFELGVKGRELWMSRVVNQPVCGWHNVQLINTKLVSQGITQ